MPQEKINVDAKKVKTVHIRISHGVSEQMACSSKIILLKATNDPQDPQGDPQEKTIEQIILEEVRKNNKITREELAEITHSSVSAIKRRLQKMKDKIIYAGSGYSGHWEIKE